MEDYWFVTIVTVCGIGFLVLVILGASYCAVVSEQREDKKLCNILRSRLKTGEAKRHARRVSLLSSSTGLNSVLVEKFAGIVEELENRLHEKLIIIFSENKEQFAQLDKTVEEMINAFCVSTAGVMKSESPTADIYGDVSEQTRVAMLNRLTLENNKLGEENKKLALELEDMRKESERIMSEYISMYSDKDEKPS